MKCIREREINGKEMNGMELSNLNWMFGNNIERMEWNHFMTILLLDPYFKINGWIYRSILEILVKNSLNLISFSPITPNFVENENLRF